MYFTDNAETAHGTILLSRVTGVPLFCYNDKATLPLRHFSGMYLLPTIEILY